MVELSITNGNLLVRVIGLDRLWAFKSSIEVPLHHVTGIRADSEIVKVLNHGWKFPGTSIPRVITAGTYYKDGKRTFWDIHNPKVAVVIDLREERYHQLVVEVENPDAAVAMVQAALPVVSAVGAR